MSHHKKTSSTGAANDPTSAQDFNVLYTAHQVHTLAQIVYHQLTGTCANRAPWAAPAGVPSGQQHFMPPMGMGLVAPGTVPSGQGLMPSAPPALYYWYP